MRIIRQQKKTGKIEFGIIYGGIAALVLCAARLLPLRSILPACAFRGITGIPCPTCGSTRAVVHLAQGDIGASLVMNPLVSVCFLGAVVYFLYSLITLRYGGSRIAISLSEQERTALHVALVAFVLGNWTYLIITL